MGRHPVPEGFGNRGARDDRVGETLHEYDSDEEILPRELTPPLEYDPTKEYTVPDPPPPSPDDTKQLRTARRAKEKAARQATRVATWVDEVAQAVGTMEISSAETQRKRDKLRRKVRAILLAIPRKKGAPSPENHQ